MDISGGSLWSPLGRIGPQYSLLIIQGNDRGLRIDQVVLRVHFQIGAGSIKCRQQR